MKQICQKNVIFVTIGILKTWLSWFICNSCHGLMQKAISFHNVAILYVKGSACRIYFRHMSQDDAIDLMNGFNLVNKMGVL